MIYSQTENLIYSSYKTALPAVFVTRQQRVNILIGTMTISMTVTRYETVLFII
jgi:hypothetical protein